MGHDKVSSTLPNSKGQANSIKLNNIIHQKPDIKMKKETTPQKQTWRLWTILCLLLSFSCSCHADDYELVANATLITDDGVKQVPMLFFIEDDDCYVWARDAEEDDFTPCIDPTLRGTLIIPEEVGGLKVKYIYYRAFKGCQIDYVRIPNSVERILPEAFKNCTNLKTITIPENVISLFFDAFAGCTSLQTVRIYGPIEKPEENAYIVGAEVFAGCTALQTVVFGEKMKYIGYKCFRCCSALKSISIPDNVTEIGLAAFELCEKLEEVRLPSHLEFIDTRCFSQCYNLKSINIPQEVKSIGPDAFSHCENLSTVRIPEGVTAIKEYAFSQCSQLKSITLPSTLTKIDNYAFSETGLTDVYLCSSTPPTVSPDGYVFHNYGDRKIDKLHVPDPYKCSITWLKWFKDIVKIDPIQEVVIEDLTWPEAGNYGDYDIYTSTPGSYVKEIMYTKWGPVDLTTTTFQKNYNYSALIYVAPCNSDITIVDDAPGYIRKSDGTLVQSDYVTNVSDGTKCYQFDIYVGERQNDMLIPNIDIELPEPVIGHDPAADMALHPYQNTTEGCTLSGIIWTVVDENRQMEEGETFQEGKVYQLMGVFTADDGYAFSDYTGCTLNGHYPDVFGKFITKDYFAFYHYYVPTNSQPTPITSIEAEPVGSDAWYSLDGRRLPSAPTRNGIYLHKGKKVVMRSDK